MAAEQSPSSRAAAASPRGGGGESQPAARLAQPIPARVQEELSAAEILVPQRFRCATAVNAHLCAGLGQGSGRLVGPGEPDDLVAGGQQFGNDG
ncbi:hypothetical protein GCM10011581_50200 [Saccharopolyspora subtropica]|uniref:Uncharacterized protein n=1 Tax=Saccharopolyspora thermophila TaxID=89367 RepID=A0A917NKE3_9PSEU|nr:hypothetical protein GCM10011581_50200 [Saccharopolyspora subtropica]